MDFKVLGLAFRNKTMLKHIAFVLIAIAVFRMIAQVPIPFADPVTMRQAIENQLGGSDFGNFLGLITGGALANMSILLVGIGPYISASIIIQLFTKAIPRFEELRQDGEAGRRKINQWTRMLTVPFAIVQAVATLFVVQRSVLETAVTDYSGVGATNWVVAILAIVAGSIILMWIGELITEQGIGNGISMVIFAGIISQLPSMVATLWAVITQGGELSVFGWFTLPINGFGIMLSLGLAIFTILTLYMIIKINEAQRVLVVNYAKRVRGNSVYGGVRSILPLKLIAAGVIPVIFALAFLSLPSFIGQVMVSSGWNAELGARLVVWFSTPDFSSFATTFGQKMIYPAVYFVLVVAFTYFYSSIVFDADEIARNLQQQGGFIDGVQPGTKTAKYLKSLLTRLNLFGSLSLGLIAMLPFVLDFGIFLITGASGTNLAMSGTGLLIVATVALENIRSLSSRALMITYDDHQNLQEKNEAKQARKAKA
ncbi:preprotein translocase subunit SecY [Candidatus Saccharibacteria bacterium]|nr:preprotein translocase subunit SecY [Candidatus Saccharibacteria bacterium]